MAAREVVRETEAAPVRTEATREVVTDRPSSGVVAARVIWYITGVIIALLALRLIFQLLGANEDNGFVSLIYGLSGFFAAPFFGMFSYEPTYGVSYFEVSTLVAMVIYALIGYGLARLFTLGSRRHDV